MKHFQQVGLWGNPIQLGPDKFHVYGASRNTWRQINMEFEAGFITIVRPTRSRSKN
jgi:hypothetical protein